MGDIDREALRPAFEAHPRYRLAEFDRALAGDTRMPEGEYLDHTLAHEFAGFCAAIEYATSDAAIERGADAFNRLVQPGHAFTASAIARTAILAAITAPPAKER